MGTRKMKPRKRAVTYELYVIMKNGEILDNDFYENLQLAKDAAEADAECSDCEEDIDNDSYIIYGMNPVTRAYPEHSTIMSKWTKY